MNAVSDGPQERRKWWGFSLAIRMTLLDERSLALFLLAASILLGLAFPPLAASLSPVALTGLFLVVIFSLAPFATLPLREIVSLNTSVARILLWQQLALPAIVVALGVLCKLPSYVISLLIVATCSGSLFAAPALAVLLNLNRRDSLQCMVLSTLVMPISLFLFLTLVLASEVQMDLRVYGIRILIFLGLPISLFLGYRPIAARLGARLRNSIDLWARWGVVIALSVFGIGMMAPVAHQLAKDPGQVLFFLGLTTIVCVFMLSITTVVMYKHGLRSAMTGAILSGFRNVGLGYALIGDMLGPELAVYTGVGLLPVFLLPAILKLIAAWRGRGREAFA